MKFIYLVLAAAAAWVAWQRLPALLAPMGDSQAGVLRSCSEVRLSARVEPVDEQGRDWDHGSAPDLVFQVDDRWSTVCFDSLECDRTLPLRVPMERVEVQLWDQDEGDQQMGGEARKQLVASGWAPINGLPGRLDQAEITLTCAD